MMKNNPSMPLDVWLEGLESKPMSDIVERLRSRKEFVLNGHTWMMLNQPDRDCVEAADLIERLAPPSDDPAKS